MFHIMIDQDILLRLFEQRHTSELYEFFLANRRHLQAELPWLALPFSHDDVSGYIRVGLERFAANNGFRAGIWRSTSLAGCLSLHSLEWNDRKASLGYWLGTTFERQGIVTRACRAVIAHAFTDLQLDRLEILCASDNVRSQQLAKRLGFQQEGTLRQSWRREGQLVDQVVYGLLRTEWQQSPAAG
jgi:ribosomal-protein-serine acetyltransferase